MNQDPSGIEQEELRKSKMTIEIHYSQLGMVKKAVIERDQPTVEDVMTISHLLKIIAEKRRQGVAVQELDKEIRDALFVFFQEGNPDISKKVFDTALPQDIDKVMTMLMPEVKKKLREVELALDIAGGDGGTR